ncbi:transmembrane protein 220-like [Lineus longissimus]|uniref:transmembrane protein 220-like n=1 Tax=Lineus longissimus TaxID=88925 RepID=UPI002B4D9F1F
MDARKNCKYKPLATNGNGTQSGDGDCSTPTPTEKVFPKPNDKKWCIIWRSINFIMVVFFLLAAFVNVNDPDWILWVPIYLVPAVFSISIVISPTLPDNEVWRMSCVLCLALNIAHAIYLSVLVLEVLSGRIENPIQHEEGRELAGTVIIIIWLSLCAFTSLGRSKPGQGAMNMLLLMTGVFGTLPLFLWGLCFVSDWHTRIGHCKDMFRS